MTNNFGFPASAGTVPNPRVPLSSQAAILQDEYAKVLAQPDSAYRTQNLNALTAEMKLRGFTLPSSPMNLDSFTSGLPNQAPSAPVSGLDSFTARLPVQASADATGAAAMPMPRPSSLTATQSANRAAWGAPFLPDVAFGLRRAWDGAAQALAAGFGHGNDVARVAQDAQQQFQRNYGTAPYSGIVQGAAQGLPALAIPGAGDASLLSLALRGGFQGAAGNVLQPEPPSSAADYWKAKAAEALQGGAIGAGFGTTLGGVTKVLGPTSAAKALMAEGVKPTIGQASGGLWKTLEAKLTSLPITGNAIKGAQASALDDFNRAIYNRILAPLGKTYSGPVGQPALSSLRNTLGSAYDTTLAAMQPAPFTNDFLSGVDNLRGMLASRPDALKYFDNAVNGEVFSRATPASTLTPSSLKDADSALGSTARDYFAAGDADQLTAARAIQEAQRGLRQMGAAANPDQAPTLRAIDNGYAQLVQLQNAAKTTKVARNEGVVTPADYLRGIKSGDTSVRDNVFSSGQALNQDLAQNADKVLSSTYPDSGTAGRGLLAAGLTAVAAHEVAPGVLTGLLGASLPYLPYIRNAALLPIRAAGAAPRLSRLAGSVAPALASPGASELLSASP